jgi:hypothetical protein
MATYHESIQKFVDEIDKVMDNLDEYADELASLAFRIFLQMDSIA